MTIRELTSLSDVPLIHDGALTKRDQEIIENTKSHVKIKSKLTNLMKLIRIEGYNCKYGSNPEGIIKILDDLFEYDQIGQ